MSISAQAVKELRERTSAGMLDCKKALEENSGDFEKAIEWLRVKGLSKAAKKGDRLASEGTILSYIHGEGRIGVLLELNSETDFVSRNDQFKGLARDIAMHIAAAAPRFVSADEISEDEKQKERAILKAKAIEEGKKAEFVDKIIDGQIKKWMAESCLLDQPYVKNPDKTVNEIVKEAISTLGENLVVRRFVRWQLGEGLEKRQNNFAEEVAAQVKG